MWGPHGGSSFMGGRSFQLYGGWAERCCAVVCPFCFCNPPTQAGPVLPLLPSLPCGFHPQNSDLDCSEEATPAII